MAQSAHIEAGLVFIPKTARWMEDFRVEIISFPHGKNDDQIDALSQALDWLKVKGFISFATRRRAAENGDVLRQKRPISLPDFKEASNGL